MSIISNLPSHPTAEPLIIVHMRLESTSKRPPVRSDMQIFRSNGVPAVLLRQEQAFQDHFQTYFSKLCAFVLMSLFVVTLTENAKCKNMELQIDATNCCDVFVGVDIARNMEKCATFDGVYVCMCVCVYVCVCVCVCLRIRVNDTHHVHTVP